MGSGIIYVEKGGYLGIYWEWLWACELVQGWPYMYGSECLLQHLHWRCCKSNWGWTHWTQTFPVVLPSTPPNLRFYTSVHGLTCLFMGLNERHHVLVPVCHSGSPTTLGGWLGAWYSWTMTLFSIKVFMIAISHCNSSSRCVTVIICVSTIHSGLLALGCVWRSFKFDGHCCIGKCYNFCAL